MGILGFSVQIAAANDFLFFSSILILFVYTGFALIYRYILSMMSTLLKLFRGRKYNVIR